MKWNLKRKNILHFDCWNVSGQYQEVEKSDMDIEYSIFIMVEKRTVTILVLNENNVYNLKQYTEESRGRLIMHNFNLDLWCQY